MEKEGFIEFGGRKIFYKLSGPKKKSPAILFIHGSGPSMSSIGVQIGLLKKSFVCLNFYHLGCPPSEGKFGDYSLKDRLDQTQKILSFLKSLPNVDSSNITVIGISMGGHVGARLSGVEDFKSLVLRVPASYDKSYEDKNMMDKWLPWQEEKKEWPWKPSYAFEDLSKFKGNLLVVESGKDEIVPKYMVEEFYKSATRVKNKKYAVMKDATHPLHGDPKLNGEFNKLITDFIEENANN